jgi:hypothetical protein
MRPLNTLPIGADNIAEPIGSATATAMSEPRCSNIPSSVQVAA